VRFFFLPPARCGSGVCTGGRSFPDARRPGIVNAPLFFFPPPPLSRTSCTAFFPFSCRVSLLQIRDSTARAPRSPRTTTAVRRRPLLSLLPPLLAMVRVREALPSRVAVDCLYTLIDDDRQHPGSLFPCRASEAWIDASSFSPPFSTRHRRLFFSSRSAFPLPRPEEATYSLFFR